MPHSSGGGGGSSSGGVSDSHSELSVSSKSHIRDFGFPGSRKYSFHTKKGLTKYVYSDLDLTSAEYRKKVRLQGTIHMLLSGLIIVALLTCIILNAIGSAKLDSDKVNDSIVNVCDDGNLFDDNEVTRVMLSLQKFYDKTGIPVTIYTTNHSATEAEAYNCYQSLFNDEGHWLIMFSSDGDHYKWEGMQGFDTDRILTNSQISDFNKNMYKNIDNNIKSNSLNPLSNGIIMTFDDFSNDVMHLSSSHLYYFIVIGLLLSILCGYLIFRGRNFLMQANNPDYYTLCDDTNINQAKTS